MAATLFGAALTLFAAFGLGGALTRRLDVCWPVRLAAGSGVLSLLLFGLMAAHQASPRRVTAVCVVSALLILWNRPKLRRPHILREAWIPLAFMTIFGIYAAVNVLSPEIESDANVYHLQPALDALTQRGCTREISFYERLPQATELLFIPAFIHGDSPAARLVHFALLLSCPPLIITIARHFGLTTRQAWTSAALFFLAPVILVTGASAFNDAALVFAGLASIAVLAACGPAWLAGLLAGFCFAIKMTGGIVILAGLIWIWAQRRQRRRAAIPIFLAAAALIIAPWILRNIIQTGDPVAPFFNRYFPNPYFHVSTEEALATALRSYNVSFIGRFPELLWGWRLHGIIGPVFLLAPLALLALRNRRTAPLVGLAALLSVPWILNAGTRFLAPALPFVCIALVSVLPARTLLPLLVLHAITSWPLSVRAYAPNSWRLHEFPWRVAAGLESRHDYLMRTNLDYHYAKVVERSTKPGDRILDLQGIHGAHIRRHLSGYWQSARAENAMRTLEFARVPGDEVLFQSLATFPAQPVTAIRITDTAAPSPSPWSIVEVELRHAGSIVPAKSAWMLDANPNPWETPFAFDRNLASAWNTWQPAARTQSLTLSLDAAEPLDTVRVIGTRRDGPIRYGIEIRNAAGNWQPAVSVPSGLGPLDLRREATRKVKQLGFTHIVGKAGKEGINLLSFALADYAPEWNLDVIDNTETLYVFRIH